MIKNLKVKILFFIFVAPFATTLFATAFFVALLISHQTLAQTQQSCKNLLTSSTTSSTTSPTTLKWHVVGEHFGKNSTYRAAKRRFGIKDDVRMTPREEVTSFFNQIDKHYSLALKDESALETLRSEWLERALIKELPESYIEHQRAIARQNGRGGDFEKDFNKEHELKILQEQQRESFLRWFDHIMGPDVAEMSPPWLRYILLEELLEIGIYNPIKDSFSQRTHETVGAYPQLNEEAFSEVYTSLKSYYEGDYSSIKSNVLELIQKDERRAFANIYAQRLNELKELAVKFDPEETEGEWIKYDRGNTNHAQDLFDSLQNQNTGWCTANACSRATNQVKGGDFYVYYSKDINGEFTVPRIAIRMKDKRIFEVRGRVNDQNLDREISKTNILEDKLKEFGDEGKRYKQKSQDMKLLTKIEAKVKSGDEPSSEELRFLYEIDRNIQDFGESKDPRIHEIISQRDQNKDYARIFNIEVSEVTSNKGDVLSGKAKVFIGALELESEDDLSRVQLKAVIGDANFKSLTSARGLENLTRIGGSANFHNLTSAEGLENLTRIGWNANFNNLISARGLENLIYIGESAYFDNLTSAEGLESLTYIGWNANFNNLINAEGLENLTRIGTDANFKSLKSARGLENLTRIGWNANFKSLKSARGLENLTRIGWNAYFDNLTSARELESLIYIGGSANFKSLTSARELESLIYIGGSANFKSLKSARGLENLTRIDGSANFKSLKSARGLESLTYIGEDANFKSLKSARGLESLTYIGEDANFKSLKSARGLENLTRIGGSANFKSLKSARGLENLTRIGWNAYFDNLTSARGLESLTYIGWNANFKSLTSARELESLIYIGGDANFNNLKSARGLESLTYIGGDANFDKLTSAEELKNLTRISEKVHPDKVHPDKVHPDKVCPDKVCPDNLTRLRSFFTYYWQKLFPSTP